MEIERFKIYREFGPSILKVKITENIDENIYNVYEK